MSKTAGSWFGRAAITVLALPDVEETMRWLAIDRTGGGSPDGVRGLAVIRGVPVPVLDVAAVLGCSGGQQWARFVSVRGGTRRVALAVEAVVRIREFDSSTFSQMPPLLQERCGSRERRWT